MRIAIYGGSFNPPHRGHVEAARSVQQALKPDRLLIIPTNIPPHKQMEADSPRPSERLAFCRLAFGDIPGAEISDLEIRRKGKSYTYDTVTLLKKQNPGASMGGEPVSIGFRSSKTMTESSSFRDL